MSTDSKGRSTCNGCARTVSGNYTDALVITRLNPDTGQVDRLHYCNDHPDGAKTVKGCSGPLVTAITKASRK